MAPAAPSNDSSRSSQSPPSASAQEGFEPFPPLTRSSTLPATLPTKGELVTSPRTTTLPHRQDRSHLAPEDAIFASPPRHHHEHQHPRGLFPLSDASPSPSANANANANGDVTDSGLPSADDSHSRPRRHARSRGRQQHRHAAKRRWKKLLWVKQSYPDNYTDQATFLENLQRNPRLQPYDFWPLVADSAVIVQHVCSVIIFVVCFVGIFQERVSPVAVVSWSSLATFLGWLLWERWDADETDSAVASAAPYSSSFSSPPTNGDSGIMSSIGANGGMESNGTRAGLSLPPPPPPPPPALPPHHRSSSARVSSSGLSTAAYPALPSPRPATLSPSPVPPNPRRLRAHSYSIPPRSHPATSRTHERLGTIKSAMLIWSTLLGLSPILKSLTRSTSSDSIWAMSFWLLAVNIFSFDYSTARSASARVPASLSTNAALMASTVLASRLPSTGQVFSLTLFSIEVFGLFPVFRRYARHRSWSYHYAMTALLVLGAGAGVGIILGDHHHRGSGSGSGHGPGPGRGPGPLFLWKNALVGMVVGALASALAVGGCSWWLIGLQKYKNEIYGPWDPARPIIMSRRQWD
ncbi:GPI2-domain-containing protein [Sodiomyces alkalinus F11]|uniref:GPI2-domain-containing protein n=1 Tax=Sodiomyces alkalinus (strain CBS 110278 / VKM F-3762 / F11) TaxID=1314773 RepID=A0A3N2PJM1_SODAK|nr:GPI2-domain-containing protein [Sodiomyces alkalinus F11]ROT34709.1 GPI2-domain-containing protein [Sodiomyces alkalinus F11]